MSGTPLKKILNAIESTNVGLWSFNVDTKESWYSSVWKSMLGLDDEVSNTWETFWERLHDDDKATTEQQIDDHIHSKTDAPYECEFRMRHADGTYRRILSFGRFNEANREFSGSHLDVTNQPNEWLFEAIINQVPALVFVKDDQRRFRYVNGAFRQTFTRHFGPTVEIIGKTDEQLLSNVDEVKSFKEADLRVLRSNRPIEISKETLTLPSGDSLVLATTKAPFDDDRTHRRCILGVSTDITRLERTKEQVDFLLTKLISSISQIESASTTDTCLEVAAYQLIELGYSDALLAKIDVVDGKRQLVTQEEWGSGMTLTELGDARSLLNRLERDECISIRPNDPHAVGFEYLAVAISTSSTLTGAVVARTKSGSTLHEESRRLLIGIATIVGLVIERSQISERIESLKSQIADQTRLLAFSTGASTVAHELNHAISTFALEITAAEKNERVRSNPEALEFVRKARKMALACTELTETKVREAQEIDREPNDELNLHDFVHEVFALILPKAKKRKCKLKANIHDRELTLSVRKHKVREILNCLINNAIEIGARCVSVESFEEKNEVVICVSDDGPGVPEENRKRIFHFGVSEGKPKTGHGLGLTLAKNAAESMGGSLRLESGGVASGEKLTVFAFRLPISSKIPREK